MEPCLSWNPQTCLKLPFWGGLGRAVDKRWSFIFQVLKLGWMAVLSEFPEPLWWLTTWNCSYRGCAPVPDTRDVQTYLQEDTQAHNFLNLKQRVIN